MMIEDRRVSEQFIPEQVVNLKVKGPEELVDRIVDILKRTVAAQPTGDKQRNDRGDPGVHQFLVVYKRDLDLLEGRHGDS